MIKNFDQLSPAARLIWAKSNGVIGYGLLPHMLDVAATVWVIMEREPSSTKSLIAKGMGLNEEDLNLWLCALAGLHDFGKATPGFQSKWDGGRTLLEKVGMPFSSSAPSQGNHSLSTAILLRPFLFSVVDDKPLWVFNVIQATSAHHGYHHLSKDLEDGTPRREGIAWNAARQEIFEAFWLALSPQGQPQLPALQLPMVNWLAGLVSTADWIGSNTDWFDYSERSNSIKDHFWASVDRARGALDTIGWTQYRPLLNRETLTEMDANAIVQKIVGSKDVMARPLQLGAQQLLQNSKGPALLVVEAPMGEGKTELAFMAHLHLQSGNDHRGLYLALPTQATGNAMFSRAQKFLSSFAQHQLDIQLVHGGAQMNEQLANLRAIDHSSKESLSASAWFGQRRRPLLSPYGVGTVDQALYSVINVKHHFVRLWGLSNRVVVLDEVHAYDTYTSTLIACMLVWLKALGCSVVLMSATLPKARLLELLNAWSTDAPNAESGSEALAVDGLAYPRLLISDNLGVRGQHVAARAQEPIELLGISEDLHSIKDLALDLLTSGGCGVVIVNTVARAQALYLMVQKELAVHESKNVLELMLFHARFPADQKAQIEARVIEKFGKTGDQAGHERLDR